MDFFLQASNGPCGKIIAAKYCNVENDPQYQYNKCILDLHIQSKELKIIIIKNEMQPEILWPVWPKSRAIETIRAAESRPHEPFELHHLASHHLRYDSDTRQAKED